MHHIRSALLQLAVDDPTLRAAVLPVTRRADRWESMPKGWDASSRTKFWETLTGDNKHKVTKCIKEMSKPGKDIDDPGAFCASLADRVLGKEWRSKKAGLWFRESEIVAKGAMLVLRSWSPSGGPIKEVDREHGAILTALKGLARVGIRGKAIIEVTPHRQGVVVGTVVKLVSGSKGGEAEDLALLLAKLGFPLVKGNNRQAFDQFNVPELLGQLKKVLLDKGLDETWDEIKRCKVPQKVNDAWMGLSKKQRKRATRLAELRAKAAASAVGQEVYLDRDQSDHFGVSYSGKSEDLVVAADALLRSKAPHEGYDQHHISLLKPLGGKTLVLKGRGYGWYTIKRVI